jgi:hypothetical protein
MMIFFSMVGMCRRDETIKAMRVRRRKEGF